MTDWAVERGSAIREISIQHEADCGMPGVFASVKDTGRAWVAVIEHYDPDRPLERIGKPCAYTAQHVWNVDRQPRPNNSTAQPEEPDDLPMR